LDVVLSRLSAGQALFLATLVRLQFQDNDPKKRNGRAVSVSELAVAMGKTRRYTAKLAHELRHQKTRSYVETDNVVIGVDSSGRRIEGYRTAEEQFIRLFSTAQFVLEVEKVKPKQGDAGRVSVATLRDHLASLRKLPAKDFADGFREDLRYALEKRYVIGFNTRQKPTFVRSANRIDEERWYLERMAALYQPGVSEEFPSVHLEEVERIGSKSIPRLTEEEARFLFELEKRESSKGGIPTAGELADLLHSNEERVKQIIAALEKWPWPVISKVEGTDCCRCAFDRIAAWPDTAVMLLELFDSYREPDLGGTRVRRNAFAEHVAGKYGIDVKTVRKRITFCIRDHYLVERQREEAYIWFGDRTIAEEPYLRLNAVLSRKKPEDS
jgi:hypothetical protein